MNQHPRVLKAGSTAVEQLEADRYNYEDLRQRCETYLNSVRQQAQQLLIDAQQQVERIKQQAAEQGRAEGLKQGLQQAEQQITQRVQTQTEQQVVQRVQKVIPALQQAVQEIQKERQYTIARWEHQVMQLVQAMTEKITHRALMKDPEIQTERIRELLKLTLGSSRIVIRLADADLKQIGPSLEPIISAFEQTANIRLLGDTRFSTGDCVVETEHGEIDARLETQLNRIVAELMGEAV